MHDDARPPPATAPSPFAAAPPHRRITAGTNLFTRLCVTLTALIIAIWISISGRRIPPLSRPDPRRLGVRIPTLGRAGGCKWISGRSGSSCQRGCDFSGGPLVRVRCLWISAALQAKMKHMQRNASPIRGSGTRTRPMVAAARKAAGCPPSGAARFDWRTADGGGADAERRTADTSRAVTVQWWITAYGWWQARMQPGLGPSTALIRYSATIQLPITPHKVSLL